MRGPNNVLCPCKDGIMTRLLHSLCKILVKIVAVAAIQEQSGMNHTSFIKIKA